MHFFALRCRFRRRFHGARRACFFRCGFLCHCLIRVLHLSLCHRGLRFGLGGSGTPCPGEEHPSHGNDKEERCGGRRDRGRFRQDPHPQDLRFLTGSRLVRGSCPLRNTVRTVFYFFAFFQKIVADIADRFKQFFRSHARYPSFSSTLRSFPRTRCRITDVLLTVRSQSFAISETGSA